MRSATEKLGYRDTSSQRTGPGARVAGSRAMTRRTGRTDEEPIRRLAQRAEEDRQAAAEGFAAVLEGIEDLRKEVRRGAQNTGLLGQRLDQLEFQVNLTRDEVQRRAVNPAPSQIESAKTAIKSAAKSWPAQVAAGCLFFTTLVVALNNIPDAIRWWDRTVVILRGADHPAPQVDAKAGSK